MLSSFAARGGGPPDRPPEAGLSSRALAGQAEPDPGVDEKMAAGDDNRRQMRASRIRERGRRRRAWVVAGLVILAAVALAGCGGGEEGVSVRKPPDNTLRVSRAAWTTDFSRHTVPLGEFASGGRSRDQVPAIDDPAFESVRSARGWIQPREPVILLTLGGRARAYPIQILIWHEIVNDTVAGRPVVVTFCPLCNTALAFDRRVGGRVLDFGTTGNLRNSDLVMYDRQTESWWQQFGGAGVVGELSGRKLTKLPATIVAWEELARMHPNGLVLSRPLLRDGGGFKRFYGANPYPGYDSVDEPPFLPSANADDDRLPPKERVVYIERGDEAVAVPFSALQERRRIEVTVGGERLEVTWRSGVRSSLDSGFVAGGRDVGTASVRGVDSEAPIVFDTPFWFAIAAFRPDAEIVRG